MSFALILGASLGAQSRPPADSTARRDSTRRGVLPTVTVQAGKRDEALVTVPAAVTVLDRQALRDARVLGIRQLENYAPNVAINQLGQVGGTFVTIRGLESNPFIVNRTALYVDGIPFRSIDNPLLTAATQVEVLRGPQGTLYGANADAGLILVRTEDPPYRRTQEASVAYNLFGTGGTVLAGAQVGGRLAGLLAGTLAVQYERGGSFVENGASRFGLRGEIDNLQLVGKLRHVTAGGWRLDAVGLLTRLRAPGLYEQEFVPLDRSAYDARYGEGNGGRRTGRFGLLHDAPKRTAEDEGALGLAATRAFGMGDLTVALSHRVERANNLGNDLDLTAQSLTAGGTRNANDYTNVEVRLAAPRDARLGWVIGATAYAEQRALTLRTLVGPGGFDDYRAAPTQRSTARDAAVFGQVVLPVLPRTRLTIGSRLEAARRTRTQDAGTLDLGPLGSFGFTAFDGRRTFGAFVPRLALDVAPTERTQLYTSVARGWLPGGFNLEATRAGTAADAARYGNEDLWTTELGARWRAASGRVDASAAVFATDAARWLEYNVLVDSTGAATSTNLITNDAAVRTRGAEVEFRARPIDALFLTGGAGIVDASYTSYRLADGRDFGGNRVKLVPRTTANLTATWRPGTGWFVRGELAHRGETRLTADDLARQRPVTLLGAQLGYEFASTTVRLFGTNLTDVRAAAGQAYLHFLFGDDGIRYAPLAPPRVVGLSVEWRPRAPR